MRALVTVEVANASSPGGLLTLDVRQEEPEESEHAAKFLVFRNGEFFARFFELDAASRYILEQPEMKWLAWEVAQ